MKLILSAILFLPLIGCAGTRASGTSVYTQANCDYLEWHGGSRPSLVMRGVNHSTPTRAGKSYVDSLGMTAAGIATTIMTKGIIK